jgi:hypothetical protein
MRFSAQHSVLGGDTFPDQNALQCKKQNHRNQRLFTYTNNPVIAMSIGGIVIEATHQLGQTGRKNLRTRIKPEVKVNKKGRE